MSFRYRIPRPWYAFTPLDIQAEGLDVYHTLLDAMGAQQRLGPSDREHRPIDAILA